MRIYKPVGSTDRLLEVFQKVNKVKLNEDLGFGPVDAKTALARGFQALKSGQLSIQQGGGNNTTVQMTDDNSTVQIVGVDSNKNEYTFVFKLTFTEGDQEGVYDVQSVQIQHFKYVGSNGGQTLELDENDLQNFNTQYTDELFDIIDQYIDVKGPQQANAEELQEAIELIDAMKVDSSPFGGGWDKMQTGQNYGDNKPTNDSVRVKSPELKKFVQEDANSLLNYSQGARDAGALYPQAQELGVTNQHILKNALGDAGIELLDIVPSASKDTFWLIFKIDGKKYKGLINRNYGNATKVVGGIKKRLEGENLTPVNELDKPAQRLVIPPSVGPTYVEEQGFEDEPDEYGQETDVLEPENPEGEEEMPVAPEEVPSVDDELPVDNEPAPEVSPEKKAKIYQAYDAIVARQRNPNYSPTTAEIMAELDKMAGISKPKKMRALTPESQPYLTEDKEKKPKEKKDDEIYSPFKQLGTSFKPTSQSKYPKKKKKPQTSVKISESTDRDKFEDVVFLQGDEAFEPLERLDREGPDAALEYLKQWHYPGEHQGSQEENHGTDDKVYRKDGYVMSWNPRLGYIGLQYDMSKLNEPAANESIGMELANLGVPYNKKAEKQATSDIAKDMRQMPVDPNTKEKKYPLAGDTQFNFDDLQMAEGEDKSQVEKDNPDLYPDGWKEMDGMFMGPNSPGYGSHDGMSSEPENDEIEQIAQDKEEAGELIPGGKGEGKSPLQFSPDQILKGMRVEMEHTDDPMIALEITIDHLTEDELYYGSEEENPELMAQANAEKDAVGGEEDSDKETTDALLGFKPHNVGDEIEGEEEMEEPESDVANTPEPSSEDEPSVSDEPEEKKELPEALYESQIKLARETLTYRRVPTGMSKKDAVQILVKHLIK